MKPVFNLVKRQISVEMTDFMFLLGRCVRQCLLSCQTRENSETYVQCCSDSRM